MSTNPESVWAFVKRLIVGVGHDPLVVSAVRGLAYVAAPMAIDFAIVYVAHSTNPVLLSLAPSLSGLLRVVEGAIDRALKPDQNAVNPGPVAGGGDEGLRPPPGT